MEGVDWGRAAVVLVGFATLGAVNTYVAVKGYDAGRVPRWVASLALASHIGMVPIVAPVALGIDVETDRLLDGVGLFVLAFFGIRWALARRAARLR